MEHLRLLAAPARLRSRSDALLLLPLLLVGAAATVAGCRVVEPERSVKPGINREFQSPDLDVAKFVQRFEGESREIATHRERLVDLLDLRPGMSVADIGAGTGLFLQPFARAVGPRGRVFAVEIAPRFIDHLRQRVQAEGLSQVRIVRCNDHAIELPDASVDVVFVCDTYHHFEYPRAVLASIRRALRPGGRLVVIDFKRIPGVSPEWVLEHVRASQEQVTAEVQAAGFRLVEELHELKDNYVLRFEPAAPGQP